MKYAKSLSAPLADFAAEDSLLLLNPAMPEHERSLAQSLWDLELEKQNFKSQVGVFTSGSSSGAAKLTFVSKVAFLAAAKSFNKFVDSTSEDHWLLSLPTFHVGGFSILARSYESGAKVTDLSSEKWNPHTFAENLHTHRITLCSLVPAQVYDLVSERIKCPSTVRMIFVGGGAITTNISQAARELGWPLRTSYGMTETAAMFALSKDVGDELLWPLDHVELCLSEDGRLKIRSDALLTGQVDSSGKFSTLKDSEGWFSSEDICQITPPGALKVLGRVHDFFKIGGESVWLSKLTQVATDLKLELGIVWDLAVLMIPDPRLGHVVALLHESSANPSELEKFRLLFSKRVMPFERPRFVLGVPKIPRTSLGKLMMPQAQVLFKTL